MPESEKNPLVGIEFKPVRKCSRLTKRIGAPGERKICDIRTFAFRQKNTFTGTWLMRIAPIVPKALLVLAGFFLAARVLGGKSPTDAMRFFGLTLAFKIFSDGWEKSTLWAEKFKPIMDGTFASKTSNIFLVFFLFFASTHAINGLGIHAYQGFDISFFVQATHNAFSERGLLFKNIDGSASFFAHHFSPFLFLLAPLGALKEAPFFLYLVQDAVMALTFALLHRRICKLELGHKVAHILLFALVLGHPFWLGLVYYEFHELSFAPLIMIFLLEAWEQKKHFMLFAAGMMLLMIKETTFFSLVWFGAYLTLFEKKRAMRICGVCLGVVATALWFFYFKTLLPQVSNSTESMFMKYYGQLGHTMGEVALSPVLRPVEFLKALFNAQNALYLFLMFAACGPFISLRNAKWLIPVVPDFMMALLSSQTAIKHPGNQYAGLVIVPVLFCAISGFSDWGTWSQKKKTGTFAWIAATVFMFIVSNPVRVWKHFFLSPETGLASRSFVQALRSVRDTEPIAVTEENLLPFAAQRENLIWMPKERFSIEGLKDARWLAFKKENLPQAMDLCGNEGRVEWSGYVLCKL